MRTIFAATISALILLGAPAVAQAPKGGAGGTAAKAAGPADAPRPVSPQEATKMLGKPVKLSDSKREVGRITDIVVHDGQVSDVVVELKGQEKVPLMVKLSMLAPDGDSYVLSMTEQELSAAKPVGAGTGASGK